MIVILLFIVMIGTVAYAGSVKGPDKPIPEKIVKIKKADPTNKKLNLSEIPLTIRDPEGKILLKTNLQYWADHQNEITRKYKEGKLKPIN